LFWKLSLAPAKQQQQVLTRVESREIEDKFYSAAMRAYSPVIRNYKLYLSVLAVCRMYCICLLASPFSFLESRCQLTN
jgi:hypothetical protein